MASINSEFEYYKKRVIPKNAGVIQIRECYQAFTAGSISLFMRILNADDVSAELNAIDREVNEWREQFKRVH